jgi:hypothetical protein
MIDFPLIFEVSIVSCKHICLLYKAVQEDASLFT